MAAMCCYRVTPANDDGPLDNIPGSWFRREEIAYIHTDLPQPWGGAIPRLCGEGQKSYVSPSGCVTCFATTCDVDLTNISDNTPSKSSAWESKTSLHAPRPAGYSRATSLPVCHEPACSLAYIPASAGPQRMGAGHGRKSRQRPMPAPTTGFPLLQKRALAR